MKLRNSVQLFVFEYFASSIEWLKIFKQCFTSFMNDPCISEDAALADLLIHVRDVSNPDHFSQNQHVLQTLRNLDVPENLIRSMITIGNKSDLVSEGDWNYIRYK